MNKKLKIILAASSLSFLTACNIIPNQSQESATEQVENQVDEPIEQSGHTSYYRPLIDEDGHYPVSENRGTTLRLNSRVNMKLFEDDLIRLAQEYFSVDTHYFQEGQYIPSRTASEWIGRESSDNNQGLNPSDEDEPTYLSSLIEHDYYQEEDGEYVLSGLSIGLALNSVNDDVTPAESIDREVLLEQGTQMANEIVTRIRENTDLPEDLPIMIGLYEQSAGDNLAGGRYLRTGISESGNEVSEWKDVDESRVVFPVQGGDTTEGNNFRNFQSQVESFFPNLNGVVGRAHYVNEILTDLSITITTQFYGQSEIVAFTHYLNRAAMTYLPENVRIEIIVESLNGTESILIRELNEDEFYTHVFN